MYYVLTGTQRVVLKAQQLLAQLTKDLGEKRKGQGRQFLLAGTDPSYPAASSLSSSLTSSFHVPLGFDQAFDEHAGPLTVEQGELFQSRCIFIGLKKPFNK